MRRDKGVTYGGSWSAWVRTGAREWGPNAWNAGWRVPMGVTVSVAKADRTCMYVPQPYGLGSQDGCW